MQTHEWNTPPVEHIEQRFVEALAARGVLPLAALQAALGGRASKAVVATVLRRLMLEGVVVRQPHRQIFWYMGYALGQPGQDDIPAPFRSLFASEGAARLS